MCWKTRWSTRTSSWSQSVLSPPMARWISAGGSTWCREGPGHITQKHIGGVFGQKLLRTVGGHVRGGMPAAMVGGLQPRQAGLLRWGCLWGSGTGLLAWLMPFQHGKERFRPWLGVVNKALGGLLGGLRPCPPAPLARAGEGRFFFGWRNPGRLR